MSPSDSLRSTTSCSRSLISSDSSVRLDAADGEKLRYADDDAVSTHLLLTDAGVQSLLFVTPDEETRALHPGLALAGAAVWSEVERGFATLAARIKEAQENGARTELSRGRRCS